MSISNVRADQGCVADNGHGHDVGAGSNIPSGQLRDSVDDGHMLVAAGDPDRSASGIPNVRADHRASAGNGQGGTVGAGSPNNPSVHVASAGTGHANLAAGVLIVGTGQGMSAAVPGHTAAAGADPDPPAASSHAPISATSATPRGTNLSAPARRVAPETAEAQPPPLTLTVPDGQTELAVSGQDLYAVGGSDTSSGQTTSARAGQLPDAAAGRDHQGPASQQAASTPSAIPPGLDDPHLNLAAEVLDDLERVRIANENRLRQLTMDPDQVDKDGKRRGFGLTIDDPSVRRLALMVQAMRCDAKVVIELGFENKPHTAGCCLEHDAERNLILLVKNHPLGPWIKSRKGVGDKQAARLLAAVGDPYWNPLRKRPRTEAEFWSYCGYGLIDHPSGQTASTVEDGHVSSAAGVNGRDPDQAIHAVIDGQLEFVRVAVSLQRGQRVSWSPTAKMRAFNVIESCLKQITKPCHVIKEGTRYVSAVHFPECRCSPYRVRYDEYRAAHRDAVHQVACRRCGPKGKPAQPGSPLSDGHAHQRAVRAATKKLLRHFFQAARRLHEYD